MTAQQQADRLLLLWQSNRHLPVDKRLPEIVPIVRTSNGDAGIIAQMDRDLAAIAAEMSLPPIADRAIAGILGVAP